MRIRSFEIKNFRSLANLKMDNLGDLVLFVGKNGAGKSNILEALELFFTDLNLATDVERQAAPDLWFDKRTAKAIEFSIVLEFQRKSNTYPWDDFEALFDEELTKALGIQSTDSMDSLLTIQRRLEKNIWKTSGLGLGNTFEAKSGKVHFRPDLAPSGVHTTNAQPTSTTADKESQSKPYQGRLAELRPEPAQMLLTKLTNILKSEFKLIRGLRESPERAQSPARQPILDPESRRYLLEVGLAQDRAKEEEWADYEHEFQNFSSRRLQTRANQLEFRTENLTLPIELAGSGDQALLILMRQLLAVERYFYAIEEPETRLHNEYVRKLHKFLKKLSERSQIFVATHSSVMLDRPSLQDSWLVSLDGQQTKAKRIDTKELNSVLLELGILPSDVFLANAILYVEGATEKYVLPELARKADINLDDLRIIPLRGKSKGKYHLDVWIEATSGIDVPAFLLLDKNAKSELDKLVAAKKIQRDQYLLLNKSELHNSSNCDFEDFYPKDLLVEGLKDYCETNSIKVNAEDLKFEEGGPVNEKIKKLVKGSDWKIPVGLYVVEKMSRQQIEDQMFTIVDFLKRIVERST